MVTAALVVVGIVAAWLLIDRWLASRHERLHLGRAAWSRSGRTFHSTGWEETVPPLEPIDLRLAQVRQRARDRAAA